MEPFLDFAVRHWYLFAALFVIIGLLIGNEVLRKIRGIAAIGPNQALQLLNHEDAVLIDTRSNSEFKNGHIPEARNIPHAEIADRLKDLSKFKSKPLILYCASGTRASATGASLKKDGFEKVYTLQGGLGAWQNANLPVTKKER